MLKKVVKGINQTETKHFHVASQTLFTKKGLTAFLTLSPKEDENDNVMTVLLRFEVRKMNSGLVKNVGRV